MKLLLLLFLTAHVVAQDTAHDIDYSKTQWSFYRDHIVQTIDCSDDKEHVLEQINLYGMDAIAQRAYDVSIEEDLQLTEMIVIMQSKYYVCVISIDNDRYSSKPIMISPQ